MPLPENVLHYGREEPLPERTLLRAGPLSLVYEAGDLRYVRLGEREILRRVYAAVRDRNWATIPARLSNVRIEANEDSFRITYDVEHQEREIDFAWRGTLTGAADGTVRFEMEGEARSTFLRNRIGICVLHPAECGGAAARVTHSDLASEAGRFPERISPHQPFMDIAALAHEVEPGVWAEVRFEGEVFEMEDQRNWTDASFKTYSTPLSIPYPVEIAAGTRVRQSVTLALQGRTATGSVSAGGPVRFTLLGADPVPLPKIGLGAPSHGGAPTAREVDLLQRLRPAHLRVDVDLGAMEPVHAAAAAAWRAGALGLPLEVAVHAQPGEGPKLRALATRLAPETKVARWLLYLRGSKVTSEALLAEAREALGPGAPIVTGTDANFVEINRTHPPVEGAAGICFAINPQVHAFDNGSLTETVACQAEAVASARALSNGLPIVVSPVTLRPRFNPDATGPEPEPVPGELPFAVDERQMSLFGAGWALGSIKYLAEAGAESVTYFETTGWRGVVETEGGSPLPERFRSLPGAVFPLYHVLADIGEFAEGGLQPARSSAPLAVDGLILVQEERVRVLLANFTPEPQQVTVDAGLGEAMVRLLDAANAEAAMTDPEAFCAETGKPITGEGGALTLVIPPFGYARLDA
jgi:hypothetical protein